MLQLQLLKRCCWTIRFPKLKYENIKLVACYEHSQYGFVEKKQALNKDYTIKVELVNEKKSERISFAI